MKSKTTDNDLTVTQEDMEAGEKDSLEEAFKNEGLDLPYLTKRLKRELNAKETKAQIPKGEKEFSYSKPMIAWDIRQKARQDAIRYMGGEPTQKHEHTVTVEDRLREIHNRRKRQNVTPTT